MNKKTPQWLVITWALGAVAAGLFIGFASHEADAARNSSGTYSLYQPGNPVVTNTPVSSTWANGTLNDIATALTNSLDRTGSGAMLAPLQLTDGTVTAPGLTFGTESDIGLYRSGSENLCIGVGGSPLTCWNATTTTIGRTSLLAPLNSQFGSGSNFPLYVTGQQGSPAGITVGFNIQQTSGSGPNTFTYGGAGYGAALQLSGSGNTLTLYGAPSGTAGGSATTTDRIDFPLTGNLVANFQGSIGAYVASIYPQSAGQTALNLGFGSTLLQAINVGVASTYAPFRVQPQASFASPTPGDIGVYTTGGLRVSASGNYQFNVPSCTTGSFSSSVLTQVNTGSTFGSCYATNSTNAAHTLLCAPGSGLVTVTSATSSSDSFTVCFF